MTRNNTRIIRTTITRKQNWEEKRLHGYFKRPTSEILHEKTWTGLKKGNLKREIEFLLIAAQNNAIKTNYVKAKKIRRHRIASLGYVVIETKQSMI